MMMSGLRLLLFPLLLVACSVHFSHAEEELKTPPRELRLPVVPSPDLLPLLGKAKTDFKTVALRFDADKALLQRTYTVPLSQIRHDRMGRFYAGWIVALEKLDTKSLTKNDLIDYQRILSQAKQGWVETDSLVNQAGEVLQVLPFASVVVDLEESRRKIEPVEPIKAAKKVSTLVEQIKKTQKSLEDDLSKKGKEAFPFSKRQIRLASSSVGPVQQALKNWFEFYNGYDPLFSWWVAAPHKEADAALTSFGTFLKGLEAKVAEVPLPQIGPPQFPKDAKKVDLPDLQELMQTPVSEMLGILQKFQTDSGGGRFGKGNPKGPRRPEDRAEQLSAWLLALDQLPFDTLSRGGQVDYLLLKARIESEQSRIELQAKIREETASLVPFERLLNPGTEVEKLREAVQQMKTVRDLVSKVNRASLNGALDKVTAIRNDFRESTSKRKTADEKLQAAEKEVDAALQAYAGVLREQLSRSEARDASGINGRPLGREALLLELKSELIPYSPEELVQIAEKEYAWCEAEMKKASQALGFGDDWLKAVEKVKTLHLEPGQQPNLIRDLSNEAVQYLIKNDLVSIPPVAEEGWRMIMMTPERQLFSPFFTGGEVISVAFPTNTMSHDAKLQSLRGNNVHFSRATVQHELIPGHHLQGYMNARYQTHRRLFGTPFWLEGWALYWEMVLYGKNFPTKPEDKVGFLFWRMHRCARIVFSLNYHLGKMSPQDCIEYLVKKVGHERDNATAEVRRSFTGGYPPLYQAAYMLGGLQFRSLREELVLSGKMTDREFHDLILKENQIPLVGVRALVTKQKLDKKGFEEWRFYSLGK
jgi:uncharacterized protein (DUF885 family)